MLIMPEKTYSMKDTAKIAKLAAAFGAEVVGIKRFGYPSGNFTNLLNGMAEYKEIFESVVEGCTRGDEELKSRIKNYDKGNRFNIP
jgi:hypothetical protein